MGNNYNGAVTQEDNAFLAAIRQGDDSDAADYANIVSQNALNQGLEITLEKQNIFLFLRLLDCDAELPSNKSALTKMFPNCHTAQDIQNFLTQYYDSQSLAIFAPNICKIARILLQRRIPIGPQSYFGRRQQTTEPGPAINVDPTDYRPRAFSC